MSKEKSKQWVRYLGPSSALALEEYEVEFPQGVAVEVSPEAAKAAFEFAKEDGEHQFEKAAGPDPEPEPVERGLDGMPVLPEPEEEPAEEPVPAAEEAAELPKPVPAPELPEDKPEGA